MSVRWAYSSLSFSDASRARARFAYPGAAGRDVEGIAASLGRELCAGLVGDEVAKYAVRSGESTIGMVIPLERSTITIVARHGAVGTIPALWKTWCGLFVALVMTVNRRQRTDTGTSVSFDTIPPPQYIATTTC